MTRHRSSLSVVLLVLLILGFASPPSLAQGLEFGRGQLVHACAASSNGCKHAVEDVIKKLQSAGLAPARFNFQLGVVAGAIAEVARQSNPERHKGLGEAVESVANASSNASQASAIRRGYGNVFGRNRGRGPRGNRGHRGHGPVFGSSPS